MPGRSTPRSAALAGRRRPSTPGCWRKQFQTVLMFRVDFDRYHGRSPSAGPFQTSRVLSGRFMFRRAADIAPLKGRQFPVS